MTVECPHAAPDKAGGINCAKYGRNCSLGVCAFACREHDGVWRERLAEHIRTRQSPVRGLGDVVERVAKPIAKGIDRVAHTHIQNCPGCAKRREKWNRAVPLSG